MNTKIGFISKIAIASFLISALIKYGGQFPPLNPNNAIALTIVLLPSLVFAIILGFRYQKSDS